MVSTAKLAALADAYASCERLARAHPENFPVASWLLPARLRPHVAAIYTFARTADDFADEPGYGDPDERLELLDEWGRRLQATSVPPGGDGGRPEGRRSPAGTEVFTALAHTRRTFALPLQPFEDLLSAFRQDVTTTRYDTWADVFEYCRRSANPVGRLVLRLFGYHDPERDRYADAICTALQLTNFWQDLAIDWRRGRLYVPAEEYRAAGADPADLGRGLMSQAWLATLRRASARTRDLFEAGRPLCDLVSGRLRYELRATWLGGVRILDRLDRVQFDVFTHRPALNAADAMVIAWRAARWARPEGTEDSSRRARTGRQNWWLAIPPSTTPS